MNIKDKEYLIGKKKEVKYNYTSERITPSDMCFVYFTLSIILIPTLLCIIVVIWMTEAFPIWLKLILTLLDLTTLYFCLYFLYKCSSTDPGIIPPLSDAILPESALKKSNIEFDYYVQY
jgi:hypothetical protein